MRYEGCGEAARRLLGTVMGAVRELQGVAVMAVTRL